jgi:NADPH-dependent ferric siderophore reductase
MGNLIESALGRPAQVLDSIESAPGFLTLVLSVPAPRGGWQPAHEIQFRVTPRDGRRYTVQAVDERKTDRITLLIAPDTGGPGSAWIRHLEIDDQKTALVAPYAPIRQHGTRRLYLGDSSALGTIAALAHDVDTPVAIEVPAASAPSLARQWPRFRFVPADTAPGDALQRWLQQALDAGELADIDGAVLLGHAQSLQNQRSSLLTHQTVDRRHITTKPYWANGKRGL